MHIAPGTEGIQPTNINWTLVLMTFIIFIAIGTLVYLMVTIVEAMKDINKALDQALATQQTQTAQTAQTAQETNQYLSPSDKALNEAWKAGYESAKAQYESLQHMPANGDISATNKTTNTTDDATDARTVETTDIIIEDATSTDNASSTTDK